MYYQEPLKILQIEDFDFIDPFWGTSSDLKRIKVHSFY